MNLRSIATLAALVFGVAASAIAQQVCVEYSVDYGVEPLQWRSSKSEACTAGFNAAKAAGYYQPVPQQPPLSPITFSAESQSNGDLCVVKNSLGQEVASRGVNTRETPGTCTSVCQSQKDQFKTVNMTWGYTRSPNIDSDPTWSFVGNEIKVPENRMVCDPAQPCQLELAPNPKMSRQSLSPTDQGLYRLSADYTATYTGEICTPTDDDKAALGKDAPTPPCPGFVGEVNGKPGCYGTAANPTRNDKPVSKPLPPTPGNPAAGVQPGDGSSPSQTPSTGNGGPAGGPAAAAGPNAGGGDDEGDGTTDKPDDGKEQQECGAPGQPKCRIDETGTPDGKGIFDQHRDKLENEGQKMTDELEKIRNTQDKDTSWGTTPTWIQHAACAPWDLGTLQIAGRSISLSIDMCPIMPWVVGVMNFIWAVGTFFAIISMVFRVTTATAG